MFLALCLLLCERAGLDPFLLDNLPCLVEFTQEVYEGRRVAQIGIVPHDPWQPPICRNEPVIPPFLRQIGKQAFHIFDIRLELLERSGKVRLREGGIRQGPVLDIGKIRETQESAFEILQLQAETIQIVPNALRIMRSKPRRILLPGELAQTPVFQFVNLLEGQINAGFDRPLPQQTRAERMYGANRALLDMSHGIAETLPFLAGRGPASLLKGQLEAGPQFGRRLAREGDRRQIGNAALALLQKGDHPLDHAPRFSGARRRFDEHASVEFVHNEVALVLIRRGGEDALCRAWGFFSQWARPP